MAVPPRTSTWRDIVSIAAGSRHTVAVDVEGNVFAAGDNTFGQCGVGGWQSIVTVSAGTLPLCRQI